MEPCKSPPGPPQELVTSELAPIDLLTPEIASAVQKLALWSVQAVEIALPLQPHLFHHLGNYFLVQDLKAAPVTSTLALMEPLQLSMQERAVLCALALSLDSNSSRLGEHILADASAAWVWAGGMPPPQITTCTTFRMQNSHSGRHRLLKLSPSEIEIIGGIPVLGVQRCYQELKKKAPHSLEHASFAQRLIESAWINE